MKIRIQILLSFTLLLCTSSFAQSIDFGRGELPVTVPSNYSQSTSWPLIVLLHGYTSSGQSQDSYWGISRLADDYGFLFVAPDGTKEAGGNQSRFWNASDACCNFESNQVDDSAYVSSIIEQMKEKYEVDDNRVYVIGHSNGGFMALRMAYEHSDVVAAAVSMAGAHQFSRRDPPPHPVHILQIHGTSDQTIAYQGDAIREVRYPSARATVERWADFNGCRRPGVGREMRDLEPSLPGFETGVLEFTVGCKPGGSAELWTISAGTHVPILADSYGAQLVEWLLDHPKSH